MPASGLAVSSYMAADHCEWETRFCSKRCRQWDINGHGTGGAVQTSLGYGSGSLADGSWYFVVILLLL